MKGVEIDTSELNGSAIFRDSNPPLPLPVSLTLRRLLNHLPFLHGRRGQLFIRASWHKPTPFEQSRSQAPFRSRSLLRTNHFGRGLRRQRYIRWFIRGTIALSLAWIVVESVLALA